MRLKTCVIVLCAITMAAIACASVRAAQSSTPTNPCPRFQPGADVQQAPDLYSHNGVLEVALNYNTIVDESNGFSANNALQLFCYSTPDGKESPTLHVWPGDRVIVHLKNNIPGGTLVLDQDGTINENQAPGTDNTEEAGMRIDDPCLDSTEEAASANIHWHGLNLAAVCGADDVMHTVVNPGHTFTYHFRIPRTQPPGLYWYHPHIHGINEGVVQGGASAAIIIEGIQKIQPSVAGLPAETFMIRDQPVPGYPTPVIGGEIPSWDLSVNYVTVRSCQFQQPCQPNQFTGDFTPAVFRMKPGQKQLWRVVNAASHTAIDLQLVYDGKPQPLTIVALDGVPVNSGDGTHRGKTFAQTNIPLGPAMRAEFIVQGPSATVKSAVFKTLRVPTGPGGDNHPERPLFTIQASAQAPSSAVKIPSDTRMDTPAGMGNLANQKPVARRKLYFSEVLQDPNNPLGPTNFYITVDGATPTLFNPDGPPSIITKQGNVEDWVIENRSKENHVFHIHQIHFLVLERNGAAVAPNEKQYIDTINIPYWSGTGPYPSVKVRMDFRKATPGDLMYHCHYIFHADFGMMAMIRVLPRDANASHAMMKPAHIHAMAMHHMNVHRCRYLIHGRCAENGEPASAIRE